MELPKLEKFITHFIGTGMSEVAKGHPKYKDGMVHINPYQGFEGVSKEDWNFNISSHQVCEKWLKDRLSRVLSKDDIARYMKIVVSFKETIRIRSKIDKVIDAHGG